MMALFGALALLLSVVGIYALVGYYVQLRRQEIGVRMALGAGRRDIVRQTLRQAATMTAFGVVIGTLAAYGLGKVLESALFGIAQSDPRLLAGFALTLTASALVAGWLPARRAAGIDPLIAMRND
jgi:ABC-type antimicrobial peptide transport system permease subunit